MTSPGFPVERNIHDLDNSKLELAFQEGHDGDIPSNTGVYTPTGNKTPSASLSTARDADVEKELEPDPEKANVSIAPASEAEPAEGDDPSEEPQDPNIVWWDGPDDPENPQNWPAAKKWGNVAVLSMLTLITPLGSSMFAPGVPDIMREFRSTSTQLATFVVSVYILGFAFGPLLVAPLSEIFGRRPLYNVGNVLFVVFSVGSALSTSMGMLVAFRFLMGFSGSSPITIGGGTIADMMPVESRGKAMAIWAIGPLLGPVIGPVAGGYLVQGAGWRWVFWLLAIVAGFFAIISLFLLRETYAPVILERKVARLRKATGNRDLRSKLSIKDLTKMELIKRSITRPLQMLSTIPTITLLSLYVAVAFGVLYLLFTTFTFVFEERYGFDSGDVGLTYIPAGIGMIIGIIFIGAASDRTLTRYKAQGIPIKPEHRLPIAMTVPGGTLLPIGLFIYGWTAEKHVHWIVPLLGTVLVGGGLMTNMMCTQTYLVDSYTVYAASAIAASTVLRSIVGAMLPLGGLQMYNTLGLGWGNSLIAFISLALVPVPVLFSRYGEKIRKKWPVNF